MATAPFAEEALIGKTLRCGDALLLVKDAGWPLRRNQC
jgi:hypothetical protein